MEVGVEHARQIGRLLRAAPGVDPVEAAHVAGADQEVLPGAQQRQRLTLGQIDRQRRRAIGVDAVDAPLGAGADERAPVVVDGERGEVAVADREDLLDAAVGIDPVERRLGLALPGARQRAGRGGRAGRRDGDAGAARAATGPGGDRRRSACSKSLTAT